MANRGWSNPLWYWACVFFFRIVLVVFILRRDEVVIIRIAIVETSLSNGAIPSRYFLFIHKVTIACIWVAWPLEKLVALRGSLVIIVADGVANGNWLASLSGWAFLLPRHFHIIFIWHGRCFHLNIHDLVYDNSFFNRFPMNVRIKELLVEELKNVIF